MTTPGRTSSPLEGGFDVIGRLLADRPSFHLGGKAHWDALPGTLASIGRAARQDDATLEVGVGASTVVFAASGARHTAISPDPAEYQAVLDYCERIGVDSSRLAFVEGFSDDVLPELFGRERTIDVAFVDGAHSFPLPILDWHYVARALKPGGKLILDDVPIPAVAQVFRHMQDSPNWRLDGVFDNRGAVFTFLAEPAPGDDWINQPFNKRYPDFCFAGPVERVRLEVGHRVMRLRHSAGERYPGLRGIYKRKFSVQARTDAR
jgi:precorrin-6B methylase 2